MGSLESRVWRLKCGVYKTGWNVTKCRACHAKRHDILLETFEKERFCSFPQRHGEATGKPETRDETRGSTKTSILCETSSNFDTLQHQNRRFPANFLRNLKICYPKIDVSCEASINFQHTTPTTESAPCRHLTQPGQCDAQKLRNTTRLKSSACHEK